MFKLHVYDPTFISGVGRDRGGLFIAVEDGVTTFVSVKPLDVTEETSGQFPVVFVAAKKWKIWTSHSGDQNRIIFLTGPGYNIKKCKVSTCLWVAETYAANIYHANLVALKSAEL